MNEIKELIDKDAAERVATDPFRALLEDLKLSLDYDAEVSAALKIKPRSHRELLALLINADQKKKERRYGKSTTVEWAMVQLEKLDPEYIKSIKRKYESSGNE